MATSLYVQAAIADYLDRGYDAHVEQLRAELLQRRALADQAIAKYWPGGLIYINREDPALLVPRRFGLGWALNFGNPRAAMLLAGVLALIGLVITLRSCG